MHFSLNDWHDFWRIAIIFSCVISAYALLVKFKRYHNDWNTKTRDLWFALWAWNLGGMVAMIEGIAQDLPGGTRLVFLTAASLVTIVGLTRRGYWGGADDENVPRA